MENGMFVVNVYLDYEYSKFEIVLFVYNLIVKGWMFVIGVIWN